MKRKDDLTIAWGGNPRTSKLPPSSGPKGKTMAKNRKGHGHAKSSASKQPKPTKHAHGHGHGHSKKPKGHKPGCGCFGCVKHRGNPADHHDGKKPTLLETGIGLLVGRPLVKALAQNLLPPDYRVGAVASGAQAGLGFLGRWGIKKLRFLKFLHPYTDGLMLGGFVAASEPVDPIVLPKLQTNLLGYFDNRVTTIGDNRYPDGRTGPTLGGPDRRVLRIAAPGAPTGATDPGM